MSHQKQHKPKSWPGDPEPEFDEDEEDEGVDDLPGMKPRQSRRGRKQQRAHKNQREGIC
jgi:hypothetical protein